MATGLNHYLKNFCDVTVSWYATDRVQCPDEMPVVAAPVRVEARTGNRFFLNYCTFGYTMPWWEDSATGYIRQKSRLTARSIS